MKIRTRLFLTILVLAALGFYMLVSWITDELGPRYLAAMEESMVDMATVLASYVETRTESASLNMGDLRLIFDTANRKEFLATIYEMDKTRLNMRVYVTDTRGMVVFDSDEGRDEGKDYSRWNDVTLTLRGEYGVRTTPHYADHPESAVLYVAAPVQSQGAIIGVVTVGKPADSVSIFLATARKQIGRAGLLAAAAVVVLGLAISFWIARPVDRLTRYAIAVRDGRRVSPPELGSSEIGKLATAFIEMKDELEGKQYVETYVQTLTHEMKSPLSAIRGAAELLDENMPLEQRRRFLENIRAETARIQDLIDRLLQLSSLEKRTEPQDTEVIDLQTLAERVVKSLRPNLEAKKIAVSVEAKAPVRVRGERFLLRQALANLLQNALDFSPEKSTIRITVDGDDGCARIQVLDEGPGVPDYAVDKIFDRFYSLTRPATGKKSSGLGLTFVREAALLHGGEATLENAPGGGAVATLSLPIVFG